MVHITSDENVLSLLNFIINLAKYKPRLTSNLLAELVSMFLLSFKFDILGPIGTIRGWIGLKEASLWNKIVTTVMEKIKTNTK